MHYKFNISNKYISDISIILTKMSFIKKKVFYCYKIFYSQTFFKIVFVDKISKVSKFFMLN